VFGFHLGAATDVGAARDLNQDSFATAASVVVVADGMGGHRGGEVASAIAANEVVVRFTEPQLDGLIKGVELANRRILDEAAADPKLRGMGTTVVALGLVEMDDGVALGAINVGDSRMYRLTGNVLEQLTEDHSLVEALVREGRLTPAEAEVHPQRNIVTRALGVLEHVEVDSFHFVPKMGDRYLLCSDGLFNEVDAQGIAMILATEPDPQQAAHKLIDAANAGGGRDNITTVIVDIVAADDAATPAVASVFANELPPQRDEPTNEHVPVTVPAAEIAESPVPAPTQSSATQSPEAQSPEVQSPATGAAEPKQRWSWRR